MDEAIESFFLPRIEDLPERGVIPMSVATGLDHAQMTAR